VRIPFVAARLKTSFAAHSARQRKAPPRSHVSAVMLVAKEVSNKSPRLHESEGSGVAFQLYGQVMPFKSEAQRRYFEANKSKLEKQGVDVKEWEQASKGMKLPERSSKKATIKKKTSA
jgi:hypothetical protein